ncbi:uncharacterized protein EI90DRAFT_2382550 [Cantharellus anzutake]|uniref:uncharacterized protein n=1 Tax=Cantharellus anzutake TaxID=1750568 RepID=UPI001904E2E4|nr:uncharacterized protein EI90DRAFT_2382550 [Cantharellus anzutake]KAF8323477.1 hypothetical protein EI90DRAFT_2382550 [Cantharellus anzutake]
MEQDSSHHQSQQSSLVDINQPDTILPTTRSSARVRAAKQREQQSEPSFSAQTPRSPITLRSRTAPSAIIRGKNRFALSAVIAAQLHPHPQLSLVRRPSSTRKGRNAPPRSLHRHHRPPVPKSTKNYRRTPLLRRKSVGLATLTRLHQNQVPILQSHRRQRSP